jgi:hypothetical protein
MTGSTHALGDSSPGTFGQLGLGVGERYLPALKCGVSQKDEGAEFRRSHDIDCAALVQVSR